MTYGLVGQGLFVVPTPATRAMITDQGDLVLFHEQREVARFMAGDAPATTEPVWRHARLATFGDHGPLLELAEGVRCEDVLARLDAGVDGGDWIALTVGFTIAMTPGVLLTPALPGDADPYFELHALDGSGEYIAFHPRPVPASTIEVHPAADQELIDRGAGELPYTQLGYEREGVQWRQLIYAVPYDASSSVVIVAQATASRAAHLFNAAQRSAMSLRPLG